MFRSLAKVQREDGFWNVSLLDPRTSEAKRYPGQLCLHTVWHGASTKSDKQEKYLPVVNKAWYGLVTESLHPNGFLGYVQGTGKQPSDSQPVGYDTVPNLRISVRCFLLAGSEMYKMNGNEKK